MPMEPAARVMDISELRTDAGASVAFLSVRLCLEAYRVDCSVDLGFADDLAI